MRECRLDPEDIGKTFRFSDRSGPLGYIHIIDVQLTTSKTQTCWLPYKEFKPIAVFSRDLNRTFDYCLVGRLELAVILGENFET